MQSSVQLLWENTDSLHFLATGASLGSGFLLALSAFAIVVAYVSRAVATLSTTSCLMAARVMAGASDADAADVEFLLGGILST
nr:hypothetical protein [Tanacetum cinerariifolium]